MKVMPDTGLALTRRLYRVYGIAVQSEVPFESLEAGSPGAAPAVHIAIAPEDYFRVPVAGLGNDPQDWIQHAVLADGTVYMKVGELFEALISADGRDVHCRRLATADDQSFEANLANFVLAAALTLQGEEPLHATVVEFEGRAIGLLGPSGAGKSTLAAFLVAHGAELVTDDMLRLVFDDDQAMVFSGPHRLKLFEEDARRFLPEAARLGRFNAFSGKVMVQPAASGGRRERRPLAALVWLAGPDAAGTIAMRRLAGSELTRALIASAMDIRYSSPQRLARQLRFAERIGRAVPVYELAYPREHSALEQVADRLRRLSES